MAIQVNDNSALSRYEIHAEGELAGLAAYELDAETIAFMHTEVDGRFEGAGLGGKLVRSALDDVRGRGLAVLPFCPFVRGWISRHEDYRDMVPAAERARFELSGATGGVP